MSDDLTSRLDGQTEFVLLGQLPRGVTWPVNQRGMTNRNYPEPDWIIWLQRARVYTIEAACLSMGWCPIAWAEWHRNVPLAAEIRETARPYLDMLTQRSDIFGNHRDADITVGLSDEKMIGLSAARHIASVENWDVANEFKQPQNALAGTSGTADLDVPVTLGIKRNGDRRLSKREAQIMEIEAAIKTLGYAAMNIEIGGKAQIKAECRRTDSKKLFGAGDHPFLDAWSEAVKQKRVRMADHDKYAGR